MKKITFFVYDIYQMGGIEKVVTLIANELSAKYEIEIVSLHKKSDSLFYKLNENIKVWNILEKELTPIKLYYPYLYLKTKKALKGYKTDIFICAGTAYVPLNIFVRKNSKYIAWEHMNSAIGKRGGIMQLGRKVAAKYADDIVVLTKKDMKQNIKLFGTAAKIHQIYNPIEYLERSLKYDINSKKIVTAGRIEYTKGFDMLVEIAARVLEKHPDWEWHIYGDGPDKAKLQKLIDKNNLSQHLKLMGITDKMNKLYNKYSMYVFTSRYEGLGIVNIEAHYAKLPIVSFNCNCGPDEIIQDEVNGYLVDCFDIDKMAEKINYLIENPNVRIKMSENTMLDKEKLQMENVIREWEKIL